MSDLGHIDAARDKLVGWFRNAHRDNWDDSALWGWEWRGDVSARYPVMPRDAEGAYMGVTLLWREHGWDDGQHPTEFQLATLGLRATWLDVALDHKGNVTYGVQIIDGLSSSKLFIDRRVLWSTGMVRGLLRVPAAWVLEQKFCPRSVPPSFYAWGAPQ